MRPAASSSAAFDDLVGEYRRPLLLYARRLVGDDDAEDIVQAVLERAWRALERGEVPAHPRAWLYLITRRLAINAWAARDRRPARQDLYRAIDNRVDVEREVEDRDEARRLLQAVAALPRRQREELELELAGRTATKSGGDRMSLYRGRQAVRRSVRGAPHAGVA